MSLLRSLLLSAATLFAASSARADPGYYLVAVYDNAGERSIDIRYWTVKSPGSPATIWPEVGLGYGVSSRWYTELYASYIGSSGSATKLDTLNWQNDLLLTQGQYPFDLALHTQLADYREGGYSFDYGPAFQTELGRTQLNANVFFAREYHTGGAGPTQLNYQWQARYRWKPMLQFGLQGFGELGEWNHWAPRDRQSHRAGPVVSGTWRLGAGQSITYDVAELLGTVYGQSGTMFSMRVQYIF